MSVGESRKSGSVETLYGISSVYADDVNLLGEHIKKIETIYFLRARSNQAQFAFEDCFLLFGSESFSSRLISKTQTITYTEL